MNPHIPFSSHLHSARELTCLDHTETGRRDGRCMQRASLPFIYLNVSTTCLEMYAFCRLVMAAYQEYNQGQTWFCCCIKAESLTFISRRSSRQHTMSSLSPLPFYLHNNLGKLVGLACLVSRFGDRGGGWGWFAVFLLLFPAGLGNDKTTWPDILSQKLLI